MRLILIDIPNPLHIAIYRRIDLQELLKLVNKEGYRALLGNLHDIFEYIRKTDPVYYAVQYLDAETGDPIATTEIKSTYYAAVTETAPYIDGYVADSMTKARVLSASESSGAEAREEELRNNVISFFYTRSDTSAVYQVDHYIQNISGDCYDLYNTETLYGTKNESISVSAIETDLLFADFEIAFEDNGNLIQNSNAYYTGVVLEFCTTVPASATFNPNRDYNQTTDYTNLATAINAHLSGENVTQYSYKTGKNRTIQFCDIPTSDLTNKNRVEFGKYIYNAFTATNNGTEAQPDYVYTYKNCNYLLKATAYLVKDGTVTFSNPVYVCYKGIAAQNDALPSMTENN